MGTTEKNAEPTPGEALKATQNGSMEIGSVQQILAAAPKDIVEETLEIPEWGYAVKVRSFTAFQAARIKNKMYVQKGDRIEVRWDVMDLAKFEEGVTEPKWTPDDVRSLHMMSGAGFQRVIDWLDEHSMISKEEIRKAEEEFPSQ